MRAERISERTPSMIAMNWVIYSVCVLNAAWAVAIGVAYLYGVRDIAFLQPNGFVTLLPPVLLAISIMEHIGKQFSKSILWTLFINLIAISFMAFVCFSGL